MGKIRILSDMLVNRIAAGEVVDRPSSVVKELAENSIDSGARRIEILVQEGGARLVKVIDDGCGMDSEDARLSLERHATSKLATDEDLHSISTMGFRGEALASIAAVSRLTLKTRPDGRDLGTELICEGGNLVRNEPIACPRGTSVAVADIFYNVPARKKHLRTVQHELRMISETVTRLAIAYPSISWKLTHDGDDILSANATDEKERIAEVFGHDLARHILKMEAGDKDSRIRGYISERDYTRKDRRFQALFVNGRFIRNDAISNAVYKGYKGLLGIGRHPAFILKLTVPETRVDVNVHPAKIEVRLDKEESIAEMIELAVRNALESNLKPTAGVSSDRPLSLESFSFISEAHRPLQKERADDTFRILGQIRSTYVLIENKDGLLIIDQHAAQERVLFDRYMSEFRKGPVAMQNLLEPIVAELSPQEAVVLKANMPAVEGFGFRLEEFGRSAFLIKSIPRLFNRMSVSRILSDIIDALSGKLDQEKEERIIKQACKAAVKANTPLEIAELKLLIKDLFACSQPYTCPHGRPTIISYTLQDLEKMFKRTGF